MLASACMRLARLTMPTMRPPRVMGSHDLLDFSAGAMGIFLGELAGPDDKFQPFWASALGAQLAAAEKIALRHHANQLALFIEDRQPADPMLQHQTHGFKNWLVGVDANDIRRHDVFDSHSRSPYSVEI